MLNRTFLHIIKKNIINLNTQSQRFSALFVNGPKATDNFLYLTPYIDFLERIKHREVVEQELAKRQSQFDLTKLEELWAVYDELNTIKTQLNKKKDDTFKDLQEKIKANNDNNNVEKLKIQLNLVKANLKKLKVPLWSAEEAAIIEALKLPNQLHALTPMTKNEVVYEHNIAPSNNKNHMEIAEKQDLVYYTKNENYYLKYDAALFELGAKFYFSDLLKRNKFIQFSNPDFTKSLVVEGCGENHTDPNLTYILHHNQDGKENMDNRLHLTGAGSLFSFFAYHAKHVLHGTVLPLKYFSMGRKYTPSQTEENNLFNVSQNSVVQVFAVVKNNTELDQMLNQTIQIIKDTYQPLGFHFRLSYISADKLHMWESLRVAIEMYSSSLKEYVEIGNISISGDFISKRLMFTYMEDKQSQFPCILSGTILNVPKFFACVLEQDQEFSLPQQFKVDSWKHSATTFE